MKIARLKFWVMRWWMLAFHRKEAIRISREVHEQMMFWSEHRARAFYDRAMAAVKGDVRAYNRANRRLAVICRRFEREVVEKAKRHHMIKP